jgi:hypothetical protein
LVSNNLQEEAMRTSSLALTAMISMFATPVLSQMGEGTPARDAPIMQALPDSSERAPADVEKFVEGQVAGQFVSSDFVGRSLFNPEGNEIGVVTDLFVDEGDQVSFIVVDVSDLVGSEKKIAFDFDALAYQVNDTEIRVVANLDRDTVEKAPSFTSLADAAALGDSQGLSEDADEPQAVDKPTTENP